MLFFLTPTKFISIPDHCFRLVRRILVDKDATEEHLKGVANITFWHCDE